jgi:hypothetical protein
MRRFAGIIALWFLLYTAAPVLACMTDTAMSHEENACCRDMDGKCGAMEKSGCCRTEVRTDDDPQVAAKAPSVDLPMTVIDWVALPLATVQAIPFSSIDVPAEHSPPGLLTTKVTVLRI